MNSWERLPAEDENAWNAFRAYRDQRPPRRTRNAGGVFSALDCAAWMTQHKWDARCKDYDRHMDRLVIAEREAVLKQSAREVTADHLLLLRDLRELAENEVSKFLDVSRQGKGYPSVKPNEMIRLVDLVMRYDRLIRGQATSILETSERLDLSKLTAEELETLEAIRAKIAAPAEETPSDPEAPPIQ